MIALFLTAVATAYLLGLTVCFVAPAVGRARSGGLGLARELTPYLFLPLPVLAVLSLLLHAPAALALALSGLVFVAMALKPRFPLHPRSGSPPDSSTRFRIMTLNAGGNAGRGDAAGLERTIRSIDADVVALQELTTHLMAHLGRALSGRYAYCHGSWPVVVFSRFPILGGSCLKFPGPGSDAQRVEVEIGGRVLTLINVHITRPGHDLGGGLSALVRLVRKYDPGARDAHIALVNAQLHRAGPPCVLAGDLNATEWSEPYRILTTKMVDSFAETARRWGNTYRIALRRWPVRRRPAVARIDYILHTTDLVALKAEVGADSASDHLPVVVELAYRQAEST